VSADIQDRVVGYWTNVDAGLGAAVAARLGRGNGNGSGSARALNTAQPD
jgi:hypothetical protein